MKENWLKAILTVFLNSLILVGIVSMIHFFEWPLVVIILLMYSFIAILHVEELLDA